MKALWFFKKMRKIELLLFFILIITTLMSSFAIAGNLKIGVYYFPGWEKNSWHWNVYKPIKNFASREPICGWKDIDTKEFMNKEVGWAHEYGIDFFAFDWYWSFKEQKPVLSYAINNFIKVNNNRLRFSVMWANHGNISSNFNDYKKIISFWISHYFCRKDYLRYDGRPIIFVFTFGNLIKHLGMVDTIRLLRFMHKKGIYVIAVCDGDYIHRNVRIGSLGFDAIAGWNYLYWLNRWYGVRIGLYSTYVLAVERILNEIYNNPSPIPIFPSVMPGWNDSPWHKKPRYIIFNNTPQLFGSLLKVAKAVVEHEKFKLKIIMIESWNEFGEGAFIIPTKRYGFSYLKSVKDILNLNKQN